ncbi:hypothetical protein KA089_01810 [Candidatus Woesebacteria bacterium]|nr:hypothetical protein [Candidatus Woesebacteria bacterium]
MKKNLEELNFSAAGLTPDSPPTTTPPPEPEPLPPTHLPDGSPNPDYFDGSTGEP